MTDELYHYNGGELYHYGVLGMKWGVRRAKRQISRETGLKVSDIDDDAAEMYRNDVKAMKKMRKADREFVGRSTLESKIAKEYGKEYGKEYADMVIKQAGREKLQGKIATGLAVAGAVALAVNMRKKAKDEKHAAWLKERREYYKQKNPRKAAKDPDYWMKLNKPSNSVASDVGDIIENFVQLPFTFF